MPTHIVLRVPLLTRIEGNVFNTIDAHNDVARTKRRVALAKFGKPGTAARVKLLDTQINDGVETLLILVVKRADKFFGYKAPLSAVHLGPPGDLAAMAPSYYEKTGETPGLWFVVNSPFVACELKGLRLVTNARPVLTVMRECRTATMLVEPSP